MWLRIWQKIKSLLIKFLLIGFTFSIIITIIFRFLPIPLTPLMLIRCSQQMVNGTPLTLKKKWVPLKNISPHLVLAVVCSEDQKFDEHNGFDFDAIEKAIEENAKRQKKGLPIKGASTISQQVAKNVFLYDGRNWIRKGLEVYFTLLIELFWSKDRIIEVYLNVIEMGNGIYGAQAAAKYYFNKNAAQLRPNEAALIAAILPNPLKWSAAKPSKFVIQRKNWILNQMLNHSNADL